MFKLNRILLILVVVLLIALAGLLYWQKIGFEKPYWAVYLNTGDLYFGKFGIFSKSRLYDAWLFQRNPQDSQNPFGVLKFENAFWKPTGEIYLNSENIVWKAKVKKDSPIVDLFKNPQSLTQSQPLPSLLQQQQQPQQQQDETKTQ